jgi:hypothetical protein
MIDPPPLIGPATPLRRVERASRDRDPGRRQQEHGADPHKQDEHEAENEGGDGVHIDVRV